MRTRPRLLPIFPAQPSAAYFLCATSAARLVLPSSGRLYDGLHPGLPGRSSCGSSALTWIGSRFNTFSCPRTCSRLIPPLPYRCAQGSLQPLSPDAPPIRIHRFLPLPVSSPASLPSPRFAYIAAQSHRIQVHHPLRAVIPLVGHHLFDASSLRQRLFHLLVSSGILWRESPCRYAIRQLLRTSSSVGSPPARRTVFRRRSLRSAAS